MSSPGRVDETATPSPGRVAPNLPLHSRGAFVVLTTQRNGSTWVMSVLNAYQDVVGQGELFLPRRRSNEKRWDSDFAYPRYVEWTAGRGGLRPRSVFRYLDAFFAQGGHVGFKLMYSQLRTYPEILPYLLRNGTRVVHLVRENHLDVLISYAVKREIGKAHVLAAEDRPRDTTVHIPASSLLRRMRWLQLKHDMARRLLRVSRLPHLEVSYEDLVRDPRRFEDILAFVGVSTAGEEPRSHILKTRQGGQKDVIANYDEVARTLADTRFAALLD